MLTFLPLTAECYDGSCPAVDLCLQTTEFWMTGYKVADEYKEGIPDTEDKVRVPAPVIIAMIERLIQQAVQSPSQAA